MNQRRNPQSSRSTNSLCRDLGHDWMTTTAANYRVCRRAHCRASQRLVNGQWTNNAQRYRFHDPVIGAQGRQRQPRPVALWQSEHQQEV